MQCSLTIFASFVLAILSGFVQLDISLETAVVWAEITGMEKKEVLEIFEKCLSIYIIINLF